MHFRPKDNRPPPVARKKKVVVLSSENLSKICQEPPHFGSTDNSTHLPAALNCSSPETSPESRTLTQSFKSGLSATLFKIPTEISPCCSYNWLMIKVLTQSVDDLCSIPSFVWKDGRKYSVASWMFHAFLNWTMFYIHGQICSSEKGRLKVTASPQEKGWGERRKRIYDPAAQELGQTDGNLVSPAQGLFFLSYTYIST